VRCGRPSSRSAVQDRRRVCVRVGVENGYPNIRSGLVAVAIVISTLILMGGDFRMFYDIHAVIIIFGGSIAATLIRFPLGAMLHGLPLGAKFVFTMSRLSARDLVDELARIAEIARKQGPVGLEKVETDEPFLAKGIRYVADGYDLEFIATTWSATATTS
jgi:chemotaxis protein MotA